MKVLITLSAVKPPPHPLINRNHLKTPSPSADYLLCERPLNAGFVTPALPQLKCRSAHKPSAVWPAN